MSGGPASGTRSARRNLAANMATPTRPPRATDPPTPPPTIQERIKVVNDQAKVCQAFAEMAKAESFTTFSGAESNTYSAFGKFRA